MSTQGQRKCRHCGVWFRPGRNAWHQHFCTRPECRAASKQASQQKWCRKNHGYFHGEQYVKKVQSWRRRHPGYWKKGQKENCSVPPDALQDLLLSQGFDNEGIKTFRNCLSEEISRPLQEFICAQQHAIVGLTAMITGGTLQEDIAPVLITCYEKGQRIGGVVPWMKQQEVNHERSRTGSTTQAAKNSFKVQLDRSSSDSR